MTEFRQHPYFPYATLFDLMLPSSLCRELIDHFYSSSNLKRTYLEGKRDFTELTIKDEGLVQRLHTYQEAALSRYLERFQLEPQVHFPSSYGYEEFRIKRYMPEKEYFGFHTDVGDHASAKRFISFLWYLNTVEQGGETVFKFRGTDDPMIKIPALEGNLLMFPPLWTYPHEGLPPINKAKFILTSYLHYL